MARKVEIAPAAARDLRKLPKDVVAIFAEAIEDLKETPFPSGVRKLKTKVNKLTAYRIRFGCYRLVYSINKTHVIILRARDRKEVY